MAIHCQDEPLARDLALRACIANLPTDQAIAYIAHTNTGATLSFRINVLLAVLLIPFWCRTIVAQDAFDSLGEIYLLMGQQDLGIKNYKKSLELNSENGNATEALKNVGAAYGK